VQDETSILDHMLPYINRHIKIWLGKVNLYQRIRKFATFYMASLMPNVVISSLMS
jgi:hypothetical protein